MVNHQFMQLYCQTIALFWCLCCFSISFCKDSFSCKHVHFEIVFQIPQNCQNTLWCFSDFYQDAIMPAYTPVVASQPVSCSCIYTSLMDSINQSFVPAYTYPCSRLVACQLFLHIYLMIINGLCQPVICSSIYPYSSLSASQLPLYIYLIKGLCQPVIYSCIYPCSELVACSCLCIYTSLMDSVNQSFVPAYTPVVNSWPVSCSCIYTSWSLMDSVNQSFVPAYTL